MTVPIVATAIGFVSALTFDSVLAQAGTLSVTVGHAITTFLGLLLVVVGFSPFTRGLKAILKLFRLAAGPREAIGNLLAYGFLLVGAFVYLHWMGIDLTSLTVFASVVGLGIGLGLQKLVNNVFSGLLLLLERPVQVGHFVELEGVKGVVERISVRFTVLRTLDNQRILIPNSELTEKRLVNHDYGDRRCRLRLPVLVAPEVKPARVSEALLAAARQEPDVLRTPRPEIFLEEIAARHLKFVLSVWVADGEQLYRTSSNLNFLITEALDQFQIARPAQEMHVTLRRSPAAAPESLEYLSDLLHRLDVFSGCGQVQLSRLIELGTTREWPEGATILLRGEPGTSMYLILRGSVEVLSADESMALATLEHGQFFGEMALLLGTPRTATIRAKEACELFVIHEEDLQDLLKRWPGFEERISQALKRRESELRQLGQMPELPENRSLVQQFREHLRAWLAPA